jgi:glycosyltransferase involved in cell wall biosynthesis
VQPKILYDDQIFTGQRYGGISRYFSELIKHSQGLFDYELAGIYSDNEHVREFNVFKPFPIKAPFKGKKRLMSILQIRNKPDSIEKIKKGNFDVFHPTCYETYFMEHLKGKPYVLTVHDMIAELYFSKDPETAANGKREIITKANHIIAISECTKNDVLRFYPDVSERISVVYHGTSLPINNCLVAPPPPNYHKLYFVCGWA